MKKILLILCISFMFIGCSQSNDRELGDITDVNIEPVVDEAVIKSQEGLTQEETDIIEGLIDGEE